MRRATSLERSIAVTLLLWAAAATLGGCGKKPHDAATPSAAEHQASPGDNHHCADNRRDAFVMSGRYANIYVSALNAVALRMRNRHEQQHHSSHQHDQTCQTCQTGPISLELEQHAD